MSTLTATADTTKSQVRLDVDFSDIDAPYALIQRVDANTGATTAVRGHGASTTVGGVAYANLYAGFKGVLYDTELPLDTAAYYTATAPSAIVNVNTNFLNGQIDPWYGMDQTLTLRTTLNSDGTYWLEFWTAGATVNPTIRAEEIPATPGATLTITASLFIIVNTVMQVGFQFLDATGAVLSAPSSSATIVNTGFTTLSFSGAAPANTVSARPYITINGTPAASTFAIVASAVVTTVAGSATSGGVLVPSAGACWLKDPLRPGSNVRVDFLFDPNPNCVPGEGVFFQSLDPEQQAANAASFSVNNQAAPITVAKTRATVSSTLNLVSRTFQDRDRLDFALSTGSPLLFQVPDEYGVPDRYLAVGTVTKTRPLPDHRYPVRHFALPFASTVAPGGPMQGTVGARWSDTCNRYATWGAVNGAGLTWYQVLDGLAG